MLVGDYYQVRAMGFPNKVRHAGSGTTSGGEGRREEERWASMPDFICQQARAMRGLEQCNASLFPRRGEARGVKWRGVSEPVGKHRLVHVNRVFHVKIILFPPPLLSSVAPHRSALHSQARRVVSSALREGACS